MKKKKLQRDVDRIVELGKKKGYVTYDEVNHFLSDEITDAAEMDHVFELLDKNKMVAREKLKELEELKKKLAEKLEPVKKQVQTKAAIMKKAGVKLTDRQRMEMKKWIDEYNALNMKTKYVQQKIAEADLTIRKPVKQDGYIKISADIFPGTIITLYEVSKVIRDRLTSKNFKLGKEGVEGH